MRCQGCDSENPDGAKFCSSCGASLALRCPKCGEQNRPGSRFCNQCGGPLPLTDNADRVQPPSPRPAPPPPADDTQALPEGERKLVTALFVDIINSTGLEQDLDPEEARALVDPALKLMIEAVRRYDGHVVQSTGDGIFALFGAPVAHEDHPQRSLYTALRLQEDIRRLGDRLRAEGRAPIQIRAGVNTGEVVVRQIQTGEAQTEYTPIGHTVNLASRVQSLADAGSIVISDATRKLVEGYFALRPMGSSRVKGIDEPIDVYEVIGLGPLRTRLDKSAGRGLSKFVGRNEEKDLFRSAAEKARSGSGQIVAVVADPGVGKSRLFFEFKTEVSAAWTVLEAFSVSHGKGSAYLPLIELLHNYFGFAGGDNASARREKVAMKIGRLDAGLENTLPYLHALLEIGNEKEHLGGMDAQLKRSRTLEALLRLLLSEAHRHPLIIIVEDMQWLDDESQAVLDLLVDRIDTAKILLLVNHRPEYKLRWEDKAHCQRVRLESLGQLNAGEMLSAALGNSPDLAPLKHVIIETTGGTPFFMEETVQALFDEGALQRENGIVKLVRPLASLRIPPTVQAILAARIDRLHNDEKNLLQTLSILGREFVHSLAKAVAGRSEADLDRLIVNLQLGEFVFEQPSIADIEYTFKHALTQEVAYNSVLLERRRQLHETVGHAIELIYSASLDDHVADLAHHFARSANQAKAIEYLQLAGSQAASRGALPQAVQDFESALALLKSFPGGPVRDQLELRVLAPLGTAYIAARGYAAPEVGPVFQRARTLCEKIGEPQQQFAVLFGNFAWRVVRGEMDLSMDLAHEALGVAERLDDPGVWMEALFLLGVTLFYRGDFVGAREQYERALSQYDDRERTRAWAGRVGEDAGVTHRCYLALALWHLGYPDRAFRLSQEMLSIARSIDHPYSLAYAQHHASWLYQQMRLPVETLASSEEGVRMSAEHGFPLFQATGVVYGAAALLLQGRTHEALPALMKGFDAYRATGAALALPYYLGLVGDALAQAGMGADAAKVFDNALAIAERSDERCQEAELYRLKGELALRQGEDLVEAEGHFLRAIGTAKEQQSKAWELRATTSFARLYQRQGRRARGRELLAAALGSYTEGFEMPDLKDAKALLAALSAQG